MPRGKKRDPNKPKPPYNLRAQITNKLRELFWWHPGLAEVRKRTRVELPKTLKNGKISDKPAVWNRCEGCGELGKQKDMRMDHDSPVVELSGFVDWNTYIARMFDAIPDGIKHLCQTCHDAKTKTERAERTRLRQEAAAKGA